MGPLVCSLLSNVLGKGKLFGFVQQGGVLWVVIMFSEAAGDDGKGQLPLLMGEEGCE